MKTIFNNSKSSSVSFHLPRLPMAWLFAFFILQTYSFVSYTANSSSADEQSFLLDSLNSSEAVFFDFGEWRLKQEIYPLLLELAAMLKNKSQAVLEITGHTDNVGSEEFNLELSMKRAEAVKFFLLDNGCKEEQIIVRAKGKSEPLEDNSTENGRTMNRRVEIHMIAGRENENNKDANYINTIIKPKGRDTLKTEIIVRDTSGEPITGISEPDITATLKWETNSSNDSSKGTVQFIPIDDKKKIAFTFTLDYSPSMYDSNFSMNASKTEKILSMEKAVETFVKQMESKHIGRIIKFGKQVDIIQPWTKSKELMLKGIELRSYPRPGTALYASIFSSVKDTAYNSNASVIKTTIAFTDGEENSSGKITKDSIYRYSEKFSQRVYTVGLVNDYKHSNPPGKNSRDESDLFEIAQRTGGFYYWAKTANDLTRIYQQIHSQIMNSYQLSILWDSNNLPPKGTQVTAVLKVKVKGSLRTIYKNYVME